STRRTPPDAWRRWPAAGTPAPARSRRGSRARPGGRRRPARYGGAGPQGWRRSSGAPSRRQLAPEVDDRGGDRDDGEEDGDGGSQPVLVALEGLLEHRQRERLRRPAGTALGHAPDDVEGLERADDAQPDDDGRQRRQHRPRHGAEQREAGGAVDPGRLERLLRDRLQADAEQQRVDARALPGGGDDHDEGVQRRVEQPARRVDAEEPDDLA